MKQQRIKNYSESYGKSSQQTVASVVTTSKPEVATSASKVSTVISANLPAFFAAKQATQAGILNLKS